MKTSFYYSRLKFVCIIDQNEFLLQKVIQQ